MSFDTRNITIHMIRYTVVDRCGWLFSGVLWGIIRTLEEGRFYSFLNNDFITRYLDSVISFESRYSVVEIKRVSWLQLYARLREYLLKSVFVLNSRLLDENCKIKFSRFYKFFFVQQNFSQITIF